MFFFSLNFFCIVACFILIALRTMPGLSVGGRFVVFLVSLGRGVLKIHSIHSYFNFSIAALSTGRYFCRPVVDHTERASTGRRSTQRSTPHRKKKLSKIQKKSHCLFCFILSLRIPSNTMMRIELDFNG